jgi:hypothetical protein
MVLAMKNVLIGIFSIPLSVAIIYVISLALIPGGTIGVVIVGYGAMLAAVISAFMNGYALKQRRIYKASEVATLAVVLPSISMVLSIIGFVLGALWVITLYH